MKASLRKLTLTLLCLSMLLLTGCSASQYKNAEGLMEAGDYEAASAIWSELGDYKDAEDKLSLCRQRISYLEAESYLADGEYDQAFNSFSMLGAFEDSAERASECLYLKAGELFEKEMYSEAAELYLQLGEWSDSGERYLETEYLYAEDLISRYSYERAYSILTELGSYRDSAQRLEEVEAILREQGSVSTASVGEIAYFGSYDQDNTAENGAERLAWVVLAKDEDKMLLLCRDAVDAIEYNKDLAATDWENSSVRRWLNEDFLSSAFSDEDAARILNFRDSAAKEQDEGCKVFLLSAEEAKETLSRYPDFVPAVPSQTAEANGAAARSSGAVCWWLRDSGFTSEYAAYMGSDGTVNTTGAFCDMRQFCVRPAVWICLSETWDAPAVEGHSERTESSAAEAPWQLAETPDAGDEYINSIIFMGDSTTYGYVNIGMPSDRIWTGSAHTMSIHEQSYINVCTEEGQMPIRMAAEQFKPDIMVITLGIRKITLMDEELFKTDYTDLVNGILEASPDTKIILNSIYPVAATLDRRELNVTNDMIDTVNGWIQDIVQETGVRYLDSNSLLKGEDGYMVSSYARSDGLHLGQEALNMVLENIRTHAYQ